MATFKSYVMFNTFPYGIKGQIDAVMNARGAGADYQLNLAATNK